MIRLTVLSLSCNSLTEIPNFNDQGVVCCIKELYLANNKITVINNLECCPHLEILDLKGNNIRIIENIGKKDKLKKLVLAMGSLYILYLCCFKDCLYLAMRSQV